MHVAIFAASAGLHWMGGMWIIVRDVIAESDKDIWKVEDNVETNFTVLYKVWYDWTVRNTSSGPKCFGIL